MARMRVPKAPSSTSSLAALVLSSTTQAQLAELATRIVEDALGGSGVPPGVCVDARRLMAQGFEQVLSPESLAAGRALTQKPLRGRVETHLAQLHSRAISTGSAEDALLALRGEREAAELSQHMGAQAHGTFNITLQTAGGESVLLKPGQEPIIAGKTYLDAVLEAQANNRAPPPYREWMALQSATTQPTPAPAALSPAAPPPTPHFNG